ncbi:DUF4435 domain-containing protein [Neobacillus jeddahensis]|uniref:DUF4435 domain-containing protein n=1 Tax=Neobacillus jeddahensis TaxID=1461580 RepID=UPI0005903331|nr:DUF4435 domain-containing protein [Neobacillus jeddahensis]
MTIPVVNPKRFVSEYQVKRNSTKSKTIVLVEGIGDEEFFKKIFSLRDCRFIICEGKENVKDTVRILNSRSQKGMLGIVDMDYDGILGRTPLIDNLFQTDTHDIETMIISSISGLHQFINMYADLDKYEKFLDRTGMSIENSIFNAAKILGVVRLISVEDEYDISFKDIQYDLVLDEYLGIDLYKLCEYLKNRSLKYIDVETLVNKVSDKIGNKYDIYNIACGHDITGIIQYALKNIFGSNKGRMITQSKIEENLRVLYDFEKFDKTNLYSDLILWEDGNKPFIMFQSSAQYV